MILLKTKSMTSKRMVINSGSLGTDIDLSIETRAEQCLLIFINDSFENKGSDQ